MPRERTTWNREEIAKKASLNKKADPYLMNQDHVKQQPSADKYVIGDPSDFAEDVHPSKGTWEAEYANGQVKRNEIGMPEMRGDTFNHPEKTAAQVEAEIVKKAALAVNVAKAMLKSASDSAIEDQATRLMKLSDEDLVATYKALVAEEDEEDEGQAEDKQAGELPPWLKKDKGDDKEEKKDDKEEKKAADQEQAQDQAEQKQAQDQGEQKQDGQGEQKQAQLDQVAQLSQMVAQLQQQVAQMVQQGQGQQVMPQVVQAQDQAQEEKKEEPAQEQKQAQMTQQAQAQMIQQAVQQALASGQDPVQAAQQAIQGCMSQPMADDGLIDEMLQQQQEPMMAGEMGIELEAAAMDTGELSVTADDAILAQLFASQESQDAEQAQGGQQKQAAVRTASTRTVGTRPTQGVSTLGGIPSAGKGEKDLSNIWASAPDVRDVFGTR